MRCWGRVLTRRRTPQFGWTPLDRASMQGHAEVVKLLLKAGADVTAMDKVERGAWEMEGWGVERAEILGKADSLGGSLDDLPGLDEKVF